MLPKISGIFLYRSHFTRDVAKRKINHTAKELRVRDNFKSLSTDYTCCLLPSLVFLYLSFHVKLPKDMKTRISYEGKPDELMLQNQSTDEDGKRNNTETVGSSARLSNHSDWKIKFR